MMDGTIKRDIVNYRRQKAHDLMHDVDILIENELWNSTVNRMYYACFHIISALLIMHEIEVKTHMGVSFFILYPTPLSDRTVAFIT